MKALVILALCALPITAAAQEQCAQIENDIARLSCFDRQFPGTDAPKPEPVGNWQVERDVDPITDRERVILSVPADQDTTCYGRRPILFVRCDQLLEVFVSHGCYAPGDNHGRIWPVLRFDDEGPSTEVFGVDTTDQAFGLFRNGHQSILLTKRLLAAERLAVRFQPYRETMQTITFRLAGLREALTEGGDRCNMAEMAAD